MKSNLVEQPQNEQTQKGISINNLLLEDTEAINENLLSCNVKVSIDYETQINEIVSINFKKETELKELTKTAVEAFNAVFDSKHLMMRFKLRMLW